MVVNATRFCIGTDKGLDGLIVESVVSLAIVCQFLCMVVMNDLPMSEKGVIMRRLFVFVCGVS